MSIKTNTMAKKRSGFPLVQILVIVIIIGFIATISVPIFFR